MEKDEPKYTRCTCLLLKVRLKLQPYNSMFVQETSLKQYVETGDKPTQSAAGASRRHGRHFFLKRICAPQPKAQQLSVSVSQLPGH